MAIITFIYDIYLWPVTIFCVLKTLIVYLYLYLDGEAFINGVNHPHIKKHPYGMMVYCLMSVSLLILGNNVCLGSNHFDSYIIHRQTNSMRQQRLFENILSKAKGTLVLIELGFWGFGVLGFWGSRLHQHPQQQNRVGIWLEILIPLLFTGQQFMLITPD